MTIEQQLFLPFFQQKEERAAELETSHIVLYWEIEKKFNLIYRPESNKYKREKLFSGDAQDQRYINDQITAKPCPRKINDSAALCNGLILTEKTGMKIFRCHRKGGSCRYKLQNLN